MPVQDELFHYSIADIWCFWVLIFRGEFKLQFETSKGRGGTRYLPYAFTEQGIAMLSGILKSQKAVDVNITIMRTFVYMRKLSMNHRDLEGKLITMEKKYDKSFKIVFIALRKLIVREIQPRKKIGFKNECG